jgi:hypothetical protein
MALSEVPFRVALISEAGNLLSRFWVRYLQSVVNITNNAARKLVAVSKTGQTAAISATALETGTLDPGVYRVGYTARITTAAGTSSSLTTTVTWTDGSVAQTQAGAAMTGNTTATQQNNTMLIHIDKGAAINYATTYATSGAPAMQYSLYVLAEQIG